MGTANFYNKNASRVFALEYDAEDEFAGEDAVASVVECLLAEGYERENAPEVGGLRSYSGSYIASRALSSVIAGIEARVEIKIVCRNGYYSHGNLDWELVYCFDDKIDGCPTVEGCREILEYCGMNAGMALIQGRNAVKFFESATKRLITEAEKTLEGVTTPLVVVARFSNGEALYERA